VKGENEMLSNATYYTGNNGKVDGFRNSVRDWIEDRENPKGETEMTLLQQAIDRSRTHTERVSVEFDGDKSDLMVALAGLYDGEIDDATENDGTVDVWGWTEEMAEGEMDWRLCVTLTRRVREL
jgi:hypothetical protein